MIWIGLTAIMVFAALLRAAHWRSTFPEPGTVVFSFQDSYYHMRRVLAAFFDSDRLPVLDMYSNFPEGSLEVWPPLFDQMILKLARIIGFGHPTTYHLELAGALTPFLLGIASMICLWALGTKLYGRYAGIACAALITVMPAHINISWLGRPDHHIAEVLFTLIAAGLFIFAISRKPEKTIVSNGLALASGTALGAGILSSVVSIGFILPGLLFLVWVYLSPQLKEKAAAQVNRAYTLMILGALIWVTPFSLSSVRGQAGLVDYEHLSWFQPITLLLALTVPGLLYLLRNDARHSPRITEAPYINPGKKTVRGSFRNKRWVIIILGFILAAVMIYITPQMTHMTFTAVKNSINFFANKGPVLKTVLEAQPLLYLDGKLTFNIAWNYFALLIPLLPLSCFFLMRRARVHPNVFRLSLYFLICWTMVTLTFALYQIRFAAWACVPLVLIHAAALGTFWGESKKKLPLAGPLILVTLALPFGSSIDRDLHVLRTTSKSTVQTFDWIRKHTPEPGHYLKPHHEPAWGILAPWDVGHALLYIGQRPVISNNFLWHAQKSINFLLSSDESQAYHLLETNQARFIYTPRMHPTGPWWTGYARVHGDKPKDFVGSVKTPDGKVKLVLKNRFLKTLYARLHLFDGNSLTHSETKLRPLKRMRLVYESSVAVIGIEKIPTRSDKVFEFVQGARLKGNAPAGSRVVIQCPIKTNHLRGFTWTLETTAGTDGVFKATLPYATHGTPYRTRPKGPYQITINDSIHTLQITEDEIQQGTSVYL